MKALIKNLIFIVIVVLFSFVDYNILKIGELFGYHEAIYEISPNSYRLFSYAMSDEEIIEELKKEIKTPGRVEAKKLDRTLSSMESKIDFEISYQAKKAKASISYMILPLLPNEMPVLLSKPSRLIINVNDTEEIKRERFYSYFYTNATLEPTEIPSYNTGNLSSFMRLSYNGLTITIPFNYTVVKEIDPLYVNDDFNIEMEYTSDIELIKRMIKSKLDTNGLIRFKGIPTNDMGYNIVFAEIYNPYSSESIDLNISYTITPNLTSYRVNSMELKKEPFGSFIVVNISYELGNSSLPTPYLSLYMTDSLNVTPLFTDLRGAIIEDPSGSYNTRFDVTNYNINELSELNKPYLKFYI